MAGRWRKTTVTQRGGEGGRARWNLNVPKPEQEQQQHHNRHHLLSAQSEGMENREEGGGLFLISMENFAFLLSLPLS